MKSLGLLFALSTFATTSLASLVVLENISDWAYQDARSRLAASYLSENMAAMK